VIDASLFLKLADLIPSHRTIISEGSTSVANVLNEHFQEGSILHFNSGDHGSLWHIPYEWNLKSAKLRDCNSGELLFSDRDSPLFVAPYSNSVDLNLTKEELRSITIYSDVNPDALKYQHRLAYNPGQNSKNLSISLPKKFFESLDETGLYSLFIDVETWPSTMKIFELVIPGANEESVLLLSHLCHTGQWNDGLAGVLVMSMVASHLKKAKTNLKYSYRLLSFPETIGSSVYLYENPSLLESTLFTLFSEMPGSRSEIRITRSRRRNSYIDRLTSYVLESLGLAHTHVDFREGWGNDEMVFDSTFAGIPSVSIDRAPFEHYHLSTDSLINFSMERLDQIVGVIIKIIELLEKDYIPKPNFFVTPQLSRLGLYRDWSLERKAHDQVNLLLDELKSERSVFDIAFSSAIPFEDALKFYDSLADHNLIRKQSISADYTRNVFDYHS